MSRQAEKIYKTVVRPAILWGLEVVIFDGIKEAGPEILRFALKVYWLDKISNEYIAEYIARGTP